MNSGLLDRFAKILANFGHTTILTPRFDSLFILYPRLNKDPYWIEMKILPYQWSWVPKQVQPEIPARCNNFVLEIVEVDYEKPTTSTKFELLNQPQ